MATPTACVELDGEPVDLTAEEQATPDALNAEYAKIEQDYQDADELPDEIDQRLGEIEAALPPSMPGRFATIRPTLLAPACSSASMPKGFCWSIVVTSGPRMKRRRSTTGSRG